MTRKAFIIGSSAFAAMGVRPVLAGDSSELAAAKEWFRRADMGLMAHWGLYSMLYGEWGGRNSPHAYSEWVMHAMKIPRIEYAKLARAFNPVLFDPLDWAKRARDAGMKYIVLTSKHHDGFALFRSKVSKYNVVDATPYGRDIVGELAEACRKTGLRMGLYYSQDLDWYERNGGGRFTHNPWALEPGRTCGNDWDFPRDPADFHFERYLEEKSLPQVEELLTQYGDLCLLWFDMPMTLSAGQSKRFHDLVRRHQPGCLINGRLGHAFGDYFTPGDNVVPDKTSSPLTYEVCGTMNESWGFQPKDLRYRSVETIRGIHEKCRGMHANYLLNFGPDPLGRMPAKAVEILQGLHDRL